MLHNDDAFRTELYAVTQDMDAKLQQEEQAVEEDS